MECAAQFYLTNLEEIGYRPEFPELRRLATAFLVRASLGSATLEEFIPAEAGTLEFADEGRPLAQSQAWHTATSFGQALASTILVASCTGPPQGECEETYAGQIVQ